MPSQQNLAVASQNPIIFGNHELKRGFFKDLSQPRLTSHENCQLARMSRVPISASKAALHKVDGTDHSPQINRMTPMYYRRLSLRNGHSGQSVGSGFCRFFAFVDKATKIMNFVD